MEIAQQTHLIDVEYLGQPCAIASCVLETDDGLAIVDPGPRSSLDALIHGIRRAGLDPADLRHILLTHIHLDHAGATGALVHAGPRIQVHVHETGARHIIEPSRLMASALRIYGDSLDRLFGEMLAVPAENVIAISGGERLIIGDRRLRVEYAPGHARHHVAWLDELTGTAFVGDTAGERFAPSTFVLPVTPPPDIDMERWRETNAMLHAWRPASLFITHFGVFADAARHLREHMNRLEDWATAVRESLDEPGTDAERAERFAASIEDRMRHTLGEEQASRYMSAGLRDSWVGLARYWRTRGRNADEKRSYTKRARARSEAKTNAAILDATLALWAESGPSATTVTAVAKRAGVQRLTVYRHFSDDAALNTAAWDRLTTLNPPPDPAEWAAVTDPAKRLRQALRTLYAHYRNIGRILSNVLHEMDRVPSLADAVDAHASYLDGIAATLDAGWQPRDKGERGERLLEAALTHAVQSTTWRSLTGSGLTDKDAARLMGQLVAAVARKGKKK